jgi:transporter family-2 protein
VAVGAAASAGVGLAAQAQLNGALGVRLGDGVAASLASTAVGVVVLLAVVPASRGGRRSLGLLWAALKVGQLRWWHCCGGLGGALFVASQGAFVGALGVGVFTVAVVGGTSAGSLAVDRWGLGPGGRRPITLARVGGAMACVAAVGLADHDRLGGTGMLALVVVPVLAGIAVATQAALNGRVGAAAGSPWAATLVSFVVAGLALCLALVVDLAVRGRSGGRLPGEPWLYAGGIVGIAVIAVAVVVVSRVGVLVFGLASVAGQLLGAVALDTLASGAPPAATTWIAVAVTLAAVVLVVRPARRPAGDREVPASLTKRNVLPHPANDADSQERR